MMDSRAQALLEQFASYRGYLYGIAYRMLGSAMEAEDMVQDCYLRWQATSEPVENPKAYLATIVSRLCLNQLQSARAQRELYVGPWLPEPVPDSYPGLARGTGRKVERDESISLAFLSLMEQLSPAERAVFILHELFNYSYAEVAGILEKSPAACRQLCSRAQRHLQANRPRFQADPARQEQLLAQFLAAINGQNIGELTAMLAEDVVFWGDGGGKVAGAIREPLYGQATVARFLLGVARFGPAEPVYAIRPVNGQPALLISERDGPPRLVIALDLLDGLIATIRVIANPDKLGALVQAN